MNTRIQSLGLVHSACWLELQQAARQRDHAFRLLALASADGEAADVRTVVLREVEADAQTLVFYTDARSAKVAQLRAQPRATMMGWSHRLGWQLRLRVTARVETDGLGVSSRWARLKSTPAAFDYLSPLPPGAPVERYEVERASRDHFAVVHAQVERLDWLELHADGHRRAVFDAHGNGQWVVP